MSCKTCGLLDIKAEFGYCVRFKKTITNVGEGDDCIYFLNEIFEDGERLTPQQHLLVQDQDFKDKKMRGPMR